MIDRLQAQESAVCFSLSVYHSSIITPGLKQQIENQLGTVTVSLTMKAVTNTALKQSFRSTEDRFI